MAAFSAFQIVQIGIAVFCGNLLTIFVIKGAQSLEKEDGPAWKYFAIAAVGVVVAATLIGSTS